MGRETKREGEKMKMVHWQIKRYGDSFSLGVCFDADIECVRIGHDHCGNFESVRDAIVAAFTDGLSAPEKNANGRDLDARIDAAVAMRENMADGEEAVLDLPLADAEEV